MSASEEKSTKVERAAMFRARLVEAMDRSQVSRSELARATGVDRSTIGQVLRENAVRLPNAGLAADCAHILGVSLDWLMGNSDRPERIGEMIDAAVRLSEAERCDAEAQVLDWHRSAAGYKIRHVPATLPDMLKTETVKAWEYAAFLGRRAQPESVSMRSEEDWLDSGQSDYEIALPIHELEAFSSGSGYYSGLCPKSRRTQLEYLQDKCSKLYPSLRMYLFDAKRAFSAPMTLFGPQLAVIYVGRYYLTFRDAQRVRDLTGHFHWLVRESIVDARNMPDFLEELLQA